MNTKNTFKYLHVHFTDGTSSVFGVTDATIIDLGYLTMKYVNGDTGILNMRNVQWISVCKEDKE